MRKSERGTEGYVSHFSLGKDEIEHKVASWRDRLTHTKKLTQKRMGTPRLYKPQTNPILGRCGIVTIPHTLKNQRPH